MAAHLAVAWCVAAAVGDKAGEGCNIAGGYKAVDGEEEAAVDGILYGRWVVLFGAWHDWWCLGG